MRFSEDFIQKVIGANDLIEIISQHTQLKPSGSGLMGRCPFPDHPEKTPSFSVSPARQVYHCFGCSKSGNIISFLRDFNGLGFREAIEYLAERASIEIPKEQVLNTEESISRSQKEQLTRANQVAAEYFHSALLNAAPDSLVKQYLDKRKITAESVTQFQIGFAPDGWDGLAQKLKSLSVTTEVAELAELIRPRNDQNGHYDFFRSRLMFPIHDALGQAIAFGGRILGEGQPKYLNSPETPVFHKGKTLYGLYQGGKHIRSQDMAILVEGYMDVIALHQAGLPIAVAPMGTALTLEQARVLARFTKNIVVLFDGDSAGQNAAVRSLPILFQAGLLPKGLFLPENLDPDDFIIKHGAGSLKQLIEKAPDLFSALLGLWLSDYRATATEKVQWTEKLSPLLNAITDPRLRQLYQNEAAWKLGVPENWWKTQGQNKATGSFGGGPLSNPNTATQGQKPLTAHKVEPIEPLDSTPLTQVALKKASNLDLSAAQMMLHFSSCWLAGIKMGVVKIVDSETRDLLQKAQDLTRQPGVSFDSVISLLTSFVDAPDKLFMDQALMTFFSTEGEDVQERYFSDVVRKLQDRYIASRISELQQSLKNSSSDEIYNQLNKFLRLRQSLQKGEMTVFEVD